MRGKVADNLYKFVGLNQNTTVTSADVLAAGILTASQRLVRCRTLPLSSDDVSNSDLRSLVSLRQLAYSLERSPDIACFTNSAFITIIY